MATLGPRERPLDGLLRGASPAGDLAARQALDKLQATLFGRPRGPVQIDRYVIEERIGAGGSGVVYRAFDPKHDRKVAIKLLHADVASRHEAARDRLLREAMSLATLSHDNVVRVYDVGTYDPAVLSPGPDARLGHRGASEAVEDGERGVYLAMELLYGSDVAAWLADRPRTWTEIRDVFVAAGRGLAAAHARGLVHRDFKPANVSIDAQGRVRVLDFGLARAVAGGGLPEASLRITDGARQRLQELARPIDATLTAPGTLLGTPAYMAPEQHERQPATAASDQYSLCLSLYEAWYGRRPFVALTEPELRQAKRSGELLPPTPQRGVPPHLFAVLRRGLSPRPEDRYPSIDALLHALTEEPSASGRRWWWWGSGAAAIAVLGAWWWWPGSRAGARAYPEAHAIAIDLGGPEPSVEAAILRGRLALATGHHEEAEAVLSEALWSSRSSRDHEAAALAVLALLELAREATPPRPDTELWIRAARELAAMPELPAPLRSRLHDALGRLPR